MDDEELQELLETSEKLEEFDWRDEVDEDNYLSLELYKAPNGQYFRYVVASGMNSVITGAQGSIEWLDEKDIAVWTEV